MRRTAFLISLALLSAAACSTSGSTAPATPPPNTVDATTSDTFNPASLTVSAGTTVTFVFAGVGHNVTFNTVAGRPADIPGTNANTSVERTFSTAGTFPYQCTIHSGMTGTITVQ